MYLRLYVVYFMETRPYFEASRSLFLFSSFSCLIRALSLEARLVHLIPNSKRMKEKRKMKKAKYIVEKVKSLEMFLYSSFADDLNHGLSLNIKWAHM